ncbi:SDR family NAD(P)-dependent oxidoreductase [Yoonia sediminilitoris]|uniref:Short-subunit dehydrogenase n=1 Tax=Yoonia sediminilitoris TaxID=1286148 RepID=A0A2T6K932_9RHOB|nr:SDR family NAD(P)-dependent oxidoreductase [Yoonia sediminilitoris]PUB11269.1 short-subunit dehydrogenase [Yoonia sediminilitoris]RCW91085.1 short-subunit dehydrogenase [Yoonia sediminilitoris]
MGGKVCAIVGFGPGLGTAYAETFKQAGYDLGLLSRSGADLEGAEPSDISVCAYRCDAGDPESLRGGLSLVQDDLGPIDVVIYNADLAQFGALDEVSELQFEQSWRVSALGLFVTAKLLGSQMSERGSGVIIVSGATAALRGNVWTTTFAPAKSAQRTLANALAKQLGPKGIHVAYLIIDGVIDTEDTRANFAPSEPDEFFIKPARIAETALMLAHQDKSAWTFELDIRPFGEKW